MSTSYIIGVLMVAVPLLLFFGFGIYITIKKEPLVAGIVAYILVTVLLLASGCTQQESAATPITDLNAVVKELDKEIVEVLPAVEEVVKGCEVRENKLGYGERTLVLCRI